MKSLQNPGLKEAENTVQAFGWRQWATASFKDRTEQAAIRKKRLNLVNRSQQLEFPYSKSVGMYSYNLPIPDLAPALFDTKIMVLSDLHLGSRLPLQSNKLNDILQIADRKRPELIIFCGDLFDRDEDFFPRDVISKLASLARIAPVFYVSGDHDRGGSISPQYYDSRFSKLQEICGWRCLDNKSVLINVRGEAVNLIGLDDPRSGKEWIGPGSSACESSTGALRIAITHNPDLFSQAIGDDFSLLLAGHTHAGEHVVGPISGTNFLKLMSRGVTGALCYRSAFHNFNGHIRGFDAPTPKTLAYITPGLTTNWNLPRIGTMKEGVAIMKLHKCGIVSTRSDLSFI